MMTDKQLKRDASAPAPPVDRQQLAGFGPKTSSMARLLGRKGSGGARAPGHAPLAGDSDVLAQIAALQAIMTELAASNAQLTATTK